MLTNNKIIDLSNNITYNKMFNFFDKRYKLITYKNTEELVMQIIFLVINEEDEKFRKDLAEITGEDIFTGEDYKSPLGITYDEDDAFSDYLKKTKLKFKWHSINVWGRFRPEYIIYELRLNYKNEAEKNLIDTMIEKYNIDEKNLLLIEEDDDHFIDKIMLNKLTVIGLTFKKIKENKCYTYPEEEAPIVEDIVNEFKKFNFKKYKKLAELQMKCFNNDYGRIAFELCGDITNHAYDINFGNEKFINNIKYYHDLLRHIYN